MGGSESKRDLTFHPQDWQQLQPETPLPHPEHYRIVRNRVTGQLLDRYQLHFATSQDYNLFLNSIPFRRNEPNIVRLVYHEPKVLKQFCGASYMLNVYLEHCRSRLSEYEDIPFPDYLYCAVAMLDGYHKLYNKVGRFDVSQYQVMIDEEGQVRVWFNSDFANNQPEGNINSGYYGGGPNDEYQMVNDIMNIILENSDEAEGPELRLSDYYERQRIRLNSRTGFDQTKNIIHQYARSQNVIIPSLFKSVYEIYRAGEDSQLEDEDGGMSGDYQPQPTLRNEDWRGEQLRPIDNGQILSKNNSSFNLMGQGPPTQRTMGPPVTVLPAPLQLQSRVLTAYPPQPPRPVPVPAPTLLPPSQPLIRIPPPRVPLQRPPIYHQHQHHQHPQHPHPQHPGLAFLPPGQIAQQVQPVMRVPPPPPTLPIHFNPNRTVREQSVEEEMELTEEHGHVDEAQLIEQLAEIRQLEQNQQRHRNQYSNFGRDNQFQHEHRQQRHDSYPQPPHYSPHHSPRKSTEAVFSPTHSNARQLAGRQTYYTLGNEVEIDPEIAADMEAMLIR